MADLPLPLPAALVELLDGLESHSPTLSVLPSPAGSSSWGTYFLDNEHEEEEEVEEEVVGESSSRREMRLRIMTAIGNCSSLRSIDLNPKEERGLYSVSDVEARALLNGLERNNRALEWLRLRWLKGFGSTEACTWLAAAVVRLSRSLKVLDMQGLGLRVEGVGHISAALRDNSHSVLRVLLLNDNDMIGDAAGARHVADILTHSPALENLGLRGIGMDGAGARLIAHAVARSTTLDLLVIGYDRHESPEQAGQLIPLLSALSRSESHSYNQSITRLYLEVSGLPGSCQDSALEAELEQAVADLLRSNTTLKILVVSSFFVTRGLQALPHNTSIRKLEVVHHHSPEDEELDPKLLAILQNCSKLEELGLTFQKPYGPSKFTEALFQGLKHNIPPVRKLILDGWQGLDDHMFQELMESLSTNTKLEHISIEGTSWQELGKRHLLEKGMRDTRVKLPPGLVALLKELESESPTLQQLPSQDVWGSYFDCRCQDDEGGCQHRGEWQLDVRLRFLTAVGNCRSLREIDLNPERRLGYSVRQVEALALLSGLQGNPVLKKLDLEGYSGFATTAASLQALCAVIQRCYRSLRVLDLEYVGLSAEGVGDIAAALGRNQTLYWLSLSGNDIGNGVGAQHLAHFLTNSPSLRILNIQDIGGMEKEGAALFAEALRYSTALDSLVIGDWYPRQAGPMYLVAVLEALVWPHHSHSHSSLKGPAERKGPGPGIMMTKSSSLVSDFGSPGSAVGTVTPAHPVSWSSDQRQAHPNYPASAPAFNHSITWLELYWPGGHGQEGVVQLQEPKLAEALARVLRSNTSLKELRLSSFFITRGLEALPHNTSITQLTIYHMRSSQDDDMDPVLITILQDCQSVEQLTLTFTKPFRASRFTTPFFQGIHKNSSIKTLVMDGWEGLDDDMFQELISTVQLNTNLEKISFHNTVWERQGKGALMDEVLWQNRKNRPVLIGGGFSYKGKTTMLNSLMEMQGDHVESKGETSSEGTLWMHGFGLVHLQEEEKEGDLCGGENQNMLWPSQGEHQDYIYTGSRIKCAHCTFLTPGFFPRLQANIYPYDILYPFVHMKKRICVEERIKTCYGLHIVIIKIISLWDYF